MAQNTTMRASFKPTSRAQDRNATETCRNMKQVTSSFASFRSFLRSRRDEVEGFQHRDIPNLPHNGAHADGV